MFERFTSHARQVVVLAQQQARMLGHDYIGTEHLLLGLIATERGGVLSLFGVTLERARGQVETIIGRGTGSVRDHIPFTPRAKRVLELSLREALRYGHNYIGTAHILLAIGQEGDGVAARILTDSGASPRLVRQEVERRFAVAAEAGVGSGSSAEGSSAEGSGEEAVVLGTGLRLSRVKPVLVMKDRLTGAPIEFTGRRNLAWQQIMPLVDAIEQRLAAIEKKLGMTASGSGSGESGSGESGSAESGSAESAGSDEAPPAVDG